MCNDVNIEPTLQPVTGEQLHGASSITEDGARLDIAANGFWGSRFERAYFDVRVFNPLAPYNRQQNLASTYKKHERSKIRGYEQRVREIEHGSFSDVSHWWCGQGSEHLLQKTHFHARVQVGSPLQLYPGLDKV